MAAILIDDVTPGVRITHDVFTTQGNLLFPKGKTVMPKDIEILRAFLIEEINNGKSPKEELSAPPVESNALNEIGAKVKAIQKVLSFEKDYEKMITLLKNVFRNVAVTEIPVLELRIQMEKLLQYSREYNILTFYPKSINKQDYWYHNAVLTGLTSYKIAHWLGLPVNEGMQVAFAGIFHDIGNAKIDLDILQKPSKLTASEVEEIRRHTMYGYELLKNVKGISEGVRLAALQHHEKVDGSGYPLRLKADQIHIYAKIVGVADIFHAMTLSKTYSQAQSPYLVLEQIDSEAFGKLDPKIVTTFISKVTQFHNGTMVRLSNGLIGEIIFSDRSYPTRPLVSVDGTIYNLIENHQLFIQEIIKRKEVLQKS